MISPQSTVTQSRVFTIFPDAEGTIPVEEIADVIALAKRTYHRDTQELTGTGWLRFRIGSGENREGATVLTLEAFYDVRLTQDVQVEDPAQLALDLGLHNQVTA